MIYKIICCLILIACAYEDIKTKEVSNIYALILIVLSLIKGFNITFNMAITIIFLIIVKHIFDANIGYGDIKIMIGLIFMYGEWYVLYSFIISAIISYIYMKIKKKESISFLPVFNAIYIILLLLNK